MPKVWTVTTEFATAEDALALQQLVAELGYRAQVSSRDLEQQPHRSPIRETRLGREILRRAPSADRSFTLEDAMDWLVRADYLPQSASPALSRMVAEGDLRKIGTGLYRLAK